MVNNVSFLGRKTRCNLSSLNVNNRDFYGSFAYKGITYCTGEFVLTKDHLNPHHLRVAQLLSVYYSKEPQHNDSPYRGSVRWYIFANDLDAVIYTGSVQLDELKEVVEYNQEHNISLENVVKKCYIILGMVDDSESCIDNSNLDSKISYFCRYKIYKNKLVPLLDDYNNKQHNVSDGLLYSILDRENCDNLMVVVTSDSEMEEDEDTCHTRHASKKFSKVRHNRTGSINLGSDGSEPETEKMDVVKVKSPINSSKILKLSNINNSLLQSPSRKKGARFNVSPPPYTIIQSGSENCSDLKMKLKVVDYFRPVKVYPTKLDENIITSNFPLNVDNITEENNCILLSPRKRKLHLYKTPTKNYTIEGSKSQTRYLRNSTTDTPTYTPQRRSARINSQTKCNYVEHNDSVVLEEIEEEKLAECISTISINNTPTLSRRKNTLQRVISNGTPNSRSSTRLSKKSESTAEVKNMTVTRSTVKKSRLGRNSAVGDSPKTPSFVQKLSENIRSVKKKLEYDSDVDDEIDASTPKQRNMKVLAKSNTKNTPSARAKMIREGEITPSVPVRNKAVVKDNTPLSKARKQLHVSYIPQALPCRENEFDNINNFLKSKLFEGCGGCMYISGVPGTGKTATVTEVIKGLESSAKLGDIPKFNYVNVNCMRLSEPRQAYVEIAKQLTGKTIGWEQAQMLIEEKFIVNSKAKSLPIVLVVDELDILCNKRQDVVYNLLDWPSKANGHLIVVTIANTMDLPERLLIGRVTSRLGLTRLTFQPYTYKQLQEIVTKRVIETNTFNPDAIQLVARKVASVSGDARRALDICRRAAEIAENEGEFTLVSMSHVNQALTAMITQPKVQAIKRCCKLEKLLLQAIVAEIHRTGIEETNFQNIYHTLLSIATLEGFPMSSITVVKSAVARLSACRLLLVDQKSCNIYQKIILNVSTDDIHYALTN